jgi:hypothetical protein
MMRRRAIGRLSIVAVACVVIGALMPAPTASATTARTNVAPSSDGGGYQWVSYFRGLAGLSVVARNPTLEAQGNAHVQYLANHSLGCETNVHDELTQRAGGCGANPYATAAGKAAANNSNITRVSANVSDRAAVSNWFSAAFHALPLLDPRLASTGFSKYYTSAPQGAGPIPWKYTAAVDVYRGRTGGYNGATLTFPATNATTPLLSYTVGTESPEPFRTTVTGSSCHSWGSKSVVSAPIIVQRPKAIATLGAGTIVDLTTGAAQPTCSLNSNAYAGGTLQQQFLGGANGITKAALYYTDHPFVVGHRYQLNVSGSILTTFTAVTLPAAPTVSARAVTRGASVSWAPPTSSAGPFTRYSIEWYTAAGCGGTRAGLVNTTQRSLQIGGLTSGHVYSIRVAAVNSYGASRWSGCQAVRPG